MTTTNEFRPCDTQQTIAQIGRMNILAISGGRIDATRDRHHPARRRWLQRHRRPRLGR